MSVFAMGVEGPRSQFTTEKMINAALGVRDEYGNRFELIRLKSNKVLASNTRTHGYEDAIISRGAKGMTIKYRTPGDIKWVRNEFGMASASIPRTPHNMKRLAHAYYDKDWEIEEASIDSIVKGMADKINSELSPEDRELNAKIKAGQKITGFGMRAAQVVRPAAEEIQNERERALAAREKELREREMAIAEKERAVIEIESKAAVVSGASSYQESALRTMKLPELRKIARRDFGVQGTQIMDKEAAITAILGAQMPKVVTDTYQDTSEISDQLEPDEVGRAEVITG
jgi:hypothetical protein